MKKRLFDILLGLSFIGLLVSYLFNHYVAPKRKKPTRMDITKANDILRRKSIVTPDALNTTVTSSACTLFLKKSTELSMNDYANEFIDHKIDSILKTCAGAVPTKLQAKIDLAIIQCQGSTRDKIETVCFSALIEAKTSSVATIIKPDAVLNDLDPSIILHLIADKFFNGDFIETPERSLALIDALLEKEPNYLTGYKLKLFAIGISSILSRDEKYAEEFDEAMENARFLKANDPELIELDIIYRFAKYRDNDFKNAEGFIHDLNAESRKNNNSWIYDYYKAQAIYKNGKGNYQQTVSLLEAAQLRDPKNERLIKTLENLKSDDDTINKHPFTASIGFSLNDF